MTFSAEWLALREPADTAARNAPLVEWLGARLAPLDVLRVLDLGAGTGANMRYLSHRLPVPRQDWQLVDHDARLLDAAWEQMADWAARAGTALTRGDQEFGGQADQRALRILARSMDLRRVRLLRDVCAGCHLVTASALLDLVSPAWLNALSSACREAGVAVLFTVIYDGRITCEPFDRDDEVVRRLVNEHQQTDKGFGAAAGPDAARLAEACFAEAGYEVHGAPADWLLPPESAALQRALIEGWAGAAAATDPAREADILDWKRRRTSHVDAGRSTLVVGHRDLAAWMD